MTEANRIDIGDSVGIAAAADDIGNIVAMRVAEFIDKHGGQDCAKKGVLTAVLLATIQNRIMNGITQYCVTPLPSEIDKRAFILAFLSRISNIMEFDDYFYRAIPRGGIQ